MPELILEYHTSVDEIIWPIVKEEVWKTYDTGDVPLHSNDSWITTDQWVIAWEAIAQRLELDPVANPENIPNIGWWSSLGWYARNEYLWKQRLQETQKESPT